MEAVNKYMHSPYVPLVISGEDFKWLPEYRANASVLDNHYKRLFGQLAIDELLVGAHDGITETNVKDAIEGAIKANKENLNRMWEIMEAEYNPLYNIDVHREYHFGKQQTTDTFGKVESNQIIGDRSTDVDTEPYNVTTTNDTTGMNTESFINDDKSTMHYDTTHTNTSSDEAQDSSTVEEHTDTHIYDAYINTEDFAGNQGITMSGQMIRDHLDVWRDYFNFWDALYKIIYKAVAISIFVD